MDKSDEDDPTMPGGKAPSSGDSAVSTAVKKQKTLLDFMGFSKSTKCRVQSTDHDKKRTTAKKVHCKECGDLFDHNGALLVHMKWRHPNSNKTERTTASAAVLEPTQPGTEDFAGKIELLLSQTLYNLSVLQEYHSKVTFITAGVQ